MVNSSIVNVVGGGTLRRELDLLQVYRDLPHDDIEYDPESFAAVVIRYDSPKATIMLYSSGNYSLAGAQAIEQAREANTRFISEIEQLLNENLKDWYFEIRYLVGTADFDIQLDLNRASILLGIEQTEYEPEQFPGLFYRPLDQTWFCILFTSGKAVFSGVKSEDELEQAYDIVKKELDKLE